MSQLNIVDLIEKNPITKLSSTYNNKLLDKIKQIFSGFEQQLFISSFYCYLNYDKNIDFVVNLDDVWEWLGFSQKIRAKELLDKHFNTPRIKFSKTEREILLKTQNSKCKMCNEILSKSYEIDHIRPLSNGGTNEKENLQALCVSCHKEKSPFEKERGGGFSF